MTADDSEMEPLETPWHQADRKRRSNRDERALAKAKGGSRQPGSGAIRRFPRDVRAQGFLIEHRRTDAHSYTISEPEYNALTQQAASTPPGLLPLMVVQFQSVKLSVIRDGDLEYYIQRAGINV
jgi:hypothetical protein